MPTWKLHSSQLGASSEHGNASQALMMHLIGKCAISAGAWLLAIVHVLLPAAREIHYPCAKILHMILHLYPMTTGFCDGISCFQLEEMVTSLLIPYLTLLT